MLSLIPWKKRNGNIRVRHDVPRRDDDYDFLPLARLREEIDSLMDRFFGRSLWSDWPSLRLWEDFERMPWAWDMDLEDREDEYVFQAELPGFEPEDFDIKVSGNVLTVRAQRREEKEEKHRARYRYGSFCRSFTLPHGVNQDEIEARYHSGVLEVRLPKAEAARGKRIEVKGA
ncbi:MAG TPA: Hsp20/alpha crystallin family protein [Planctomycetaceae bacterium]|nr:Hsp20/alpha crystallin family protein [Planctomycetaceae bacterium]HIQ21605.1 Hsp20/alpha crystallin family protein [Planctomycetota bacterium]